MCMIPWGLLFFCNETRELEDKNTRRWRPWYVQKYIDIYMGSWYISKGKTILAYTPTRYSSRAGQIGLLWWFSGDPLVVSVGESALRQDGRTRLLSRTLERPVLHEENARGDPRWGPLILYLFGRVICFFFFSSLSSVFYFHRISRSFPSHLTTISF